MAYPTDPIYKIYRSPISNIETAILKNSDGIESSIPKDEANTDYQEYLKWVAEGNTAEAAD